MAARLNRKLTELQLRIACPLPVAACLGCTGGPTIMTHKRILHLLLTSVMLAGARCGNTAAPAQ